MAITTPGVGKELGPLARRVETMERDFGRFSAIRIIADDEFGKPKKFTVLAARGAPAEDVPVDGAFFGVYKDIKKGGWCLQGGQVTAGSKSEALAYVFLVKVGSEPDNGHLHWLTITGDGTVVNGRLQGGFNMTSVVSGHGTSLPAITLPTKASPKGKVYHILLGTWQDKRFAPSQTGNIGISFCPSSGYTATR